MLKMKKTFIILMMLFFIFAYLEGGDLPYGMFFAFALVFLSSVLYINMKKKKLTVKVRFDREMYSVGDEDKFSIIVENDDLIPAPYVIVKNKAYAELNNRYQGDVLSLNSLENKGLRNNVTFRVRGIYNFGENEITVRDLFGIFEKTIYSKADSEVKVYPRIYRIKDLFWGGNDSFEYIQTSRKRNEDFTAVRDVRKYRIGDNLKKIHWKVSAKYGELYVKNFDHISGQECNIFLDMSRNEFLGEQLLEQEEKLIDLCVSIAHTAEEREVDSTIFVNHKQGKAFKVRTREDFLKLMDYFITIKSDGEWEFMPFVEARLNQIPRMGWLCLITTNLKGDFEDRVVKIKDLGYEISLFYLTNDVNDLEKIDTLRKIGIQCINVDDILTQIEK